MNIENTYTLKDGKGVACERLVILNECYNQFSLNCLKQIDLSNKTVLEVGCGIGLFSCELARLVGPHGKVVAIDISQKQLDIAKENSDKQKIKNIEFIRCSAFELNTLNRKFDCVYSRFLLTHLYNPEVVLKQELDCLNINGYLISAEPNLGYNSMHCEPESEVFNKIKKVHILQTQTYNTDFFIGNKIPGILKEFGSKQIYSKASIAHLTTPKKKMQLRLAMIELSDVLISKGFMTQDEVDLLLRELKVFELDNHVVDYFSCMETCVKKING